jgi:KS-AT-KR-ACP domain-containing polyene macrolide polyketide synthase/pimaricinolide synthase PimS2/candicidin polyketide synthase FscD
MAAGIEANGYMTGGVTNAIGLCAIERLLSGWQQPGVFVADMVWQQFLQLYSHAPPLLAGFETKHQPTVTTKQGVCLHSNAIISSLLQLTPSERAAQLEATVLEHVVSMSGQPEMGLDVPLMEAGLDSLAAIELTNQLSQSLGDGVVLSATVLFDYPTVSQLAAHIGSLLCWEEPVEAHAVLLAVVPHGDASVQESLMVAGAGCVLPGASNNSAKFWCVLSNAVDPICGVPSGRWDERQHAESPEQVGGSKCYVQCGGFVAGLEGFDIMHFRISASEVKQMDPQQRVVLEVCMLQCVLAHLGN